MKSFVVTKLEELKDKATQEEAEAGFMNPAKKRGGRRPGAGRKSKKVEGENPEVEAQAPEINNVDQIKKAIKPAVGVISTVGERLGGPKAVMTSDEMSVIVDAAAECVNQYLPDVLGRHANAVVLALALGNYSLRVYQCRQMAIMEYRERVRAQGVSPGQSNGNGQAKSEATEEPRAPFYAGPMTSYPGL